MGVAEILEAIRAETDAEIDRRRTAVEARAAKQRAAGVAEAAGAEADAASARDAAAARGAARIVNRARLEADQLARQAAEGVHRSALAQLEDRLRGLRTGPGYGAIFARQLAEALADLPDATRLLVDPRDAELADHVVGDLARPLSIEPSLSCWGGFCIADEAGRRVSNTFEDRLARADAVVRLVAARFTAGR